MPAAGGAAAGARKGEVQVLHAQTAGPGQPGPWVPPGAAPVHRAGPDGMGDGGGQHAGADQASGGARGRHDQDTGERNSTTRGGGVCQERQAPAHGERVGSRREAPEGPTGGGSYGRRHGPCHPVRAGVGHAPAKEKCDAAPLLRAAGGMAGRIPRPFIADGPDRYHAAPKAFLMLKGPHPSTPATSASGTARATPTSGSASTGGRGPLQVRPRHKQGVADIPHGHITPPFHQAAQWDRQQDARRGRRHRHTGYGQVADVIPERRIHRVGGRECPTCRPGVDFRPRPTPAGLCQKPAKNTF